MRVDVSPREAQVVPALPITISVSIANTSTVIGGYVIRVLGADPSWVELEAGQISLFPDESRTVDVTITPPRGLAAGIRRVAVQVRELTPPHETTVADVDLTVPSADAVLLNLDPLAVTAGRTAAFTVLVENTGNTMLRARPAGEDPEGKVRFEFEPADLELAPGEHAVVDMRLKARRKLTGSPTVRTFNLYLDRFSPNAFFAAPDTAPSGPSREDEDALATGTFLQRSVLARSALSLLGLLAAITVFAIVITIAVSRLVGQSAADRNLALQIAAARNSTTTSGTSGIAGTVRLLTKGTPVSGVTVVVFDAGNTSVPLATTATDSRGRYQVTNLAAGKFKIEYRGAGLVQLWYPGAATDADASTVTLATGQQQTGLDVSLGGVPASISGSVTGDDVSAATLYLETLGPPGSSSSQVSTNSVPSGGAVSPIAGSAVVQTVPIGADGIFTLSNVPSPASYQLVVMKTGYATSTQQVDVAAGQVRTGVNILLSKGDGSIAGTVTAGSGPLGNATISATTGQTAVNTVTLTGNQAGTFTLRQLPTPASYTLVASASGYASQTLTVTLTAGQNLTGLAITLSSSSGKLSGAVSVQHPARAPTPATGVAVTVTDGQLTVRTETESTTDPGQWEVGGLPIPGTYTVTFSRADLATETVSVSLDATGRVTQGTLGSAGISVMMRSATAVVYGTVSQAGSSTSCSGSTDLGEATVTLNSGTATYTVITASVPAARCGQYRVENVPPGTYTLTASAGSGTSPKSRVITLGAGDEARADFDLEAPASLSGVVETSAGDLLCGWTVDLYLQDQYPFTTLRTTTTPPVGSGGTCTTGTFSFTDIPAGTYVISVGPAPGNPVTTVRKTVQPSQQLTGVVVKVHQ
jgi:type II secretory pathway pseudopilin PulG